MLASDVIPTLVVDVYPESEAGALIRAIDRVCPEDVQARFEALAQEGERLQWQQGDLTNQIWSSVLAAKLVNQAGRRYQFSDVCFYVSRRFLRGSRSHNTVKAWALTARRYSPSVRARFRYLDVPFSHFSYAGRDKWDRTNPATGHKLWMDILDHSWELSQKQGYPASERQLREKFEPETVTQLSPSQVWHTGAGSDGSLEFAPFVLGPGPALDAPAPVVDFEAELRDELHRLQALVQGVARARPGIGTALLRALDLMWSALGGRS